MNARKVNYGGWPNCYRLSNPQVELIVTTDVGPRIIRFGFVGEDNEFCEFGEMLGKRGGNEWRIYGGHRLWHAPEAEPRTYAPDNSPVRLERHGDVVRLIQPTQPILGVGVLSLMARWLGEIQRMQKIGFRLTRGLSWIRCFVTDFFFPPISRMEHIYRRLRKFLGIMERSR